MGSEPAVECKLIEGYRALLAQGTLVALVITALVVKRRFENPQRPFVVWLMDVSKQAFSASSCHACNILFALLASSGHTQASQCSWYFIQYNVDNILGVSMTILAHQTFVTVARLLSTWGEDEGKSQGSWKIADALSRCGEYGDPPSIMRWGIQASEWVISVMVGRTISGMTTVLLRSVLWYSLAEGLDSLFMNRPIQLVFFVLVLYPLFCSLTVAWIQDGVLKLRTHCGDIIDDSLSSEPLLQSIGVDNECDDTCDCEQENCTRLVVGSLSDSEEDNDSSVAENPYDIDSAFDNSPPGKKKGNSHFPS